MSSPASTERRSRRARRLRSPGCAFRAGTGEPSVDAPPPGIRPPPQACHHPASPRAPGWADLAVRTQVRSPSAVTPGRQPSSPAYCRLRHRRHRGPVPRRVRPPPGHAPSPIRARHPAFSPGPRRWRSPARRRHRCSPRATGCSEVALRRDVGWDCGVSAWRDRVSVLGWVGSSGGWFTRRLLEVGDDLRSTIRRQPVARLWRAQPSAGRSGRPSQEAHSGPMDSPQCPTADGAMTTTRAVSAPALQRPDGTPVRVLVVDDEPNLTELLSMALRYEGWEVRTAASGLAAVRSAKDFGPDAVVLDMMLPDFDGLEVLRRMRGERPERAGAVPHRQGRRRGPHRRAHRRWRRLRDQAVQPRGGRRAAARPDAAHHGVDRRGQLAAGRRGPDDGRGQPRGHPRRRA